MKKYSINSSMSNEDFVRELFSPYISALNVKDKNGEFLDLNKSRVSKLLSCADDAPKTMREKTTTIGVCEIIKEGFCDFVEDCLDSTCLSELVDEMCALYRKPIDLDRATEAIDILVYLFVEAVRAPNKDAGDKNENVKLWQKGNSSIELISGDIFKYGFGNRSKKNKNIIVVPVNTAFDTRVSVCHEKDICPLVSKNTLHGKFLERWQKSGRSIEDLDIRIQSNLRLQGAQYIKTSASQIGKPHCYEIGTIAVIDIDKASFFLLAISSFDENNQAHASKDDVKKAIISLIQTYEKIGQGDAIYIPLLGTGRSRVGLNYQESVDLLREILIENSEHINGKIKIAVENKVFDSLTI